MYPDMRIPKKFRTKSTELFHFKALVIFVFAVYGILIPLWFAFHGNKLLGNNDQWRKMVLSSTSTRITRSHIKENGYFDVKKNLDIRSIENKKYLGKKKKNALIKHRTKRPPTLPKPIHSFYLWPIFMPPQARRKSAHHYTGRLLSMKWGHLCCQTINCLRKFPLFPLLPSRKKFIRRLKFSDSGKMYGERITGLLKPPESGRYAIYIKCLSTCEFWLSDNEYPLYTRLKKKIVRGIPVEHDMKTNNSDSRSSHFKVHLEAGRAYFMDFLLTVYRYMKRPFEISWKLPSRNTFIPLTQEFFVGFQKNPESMTSVLQLHAYSPSVRLSSYLESIEEHGEDDDDFTILGGKTDLTMNSTFLDGQGNQIFVNLNFKDDDLFLKSNKSRLSLKKCSHKPLFARNTTLTKYGGVWKTSLSSVFPGDETGHMMCIGNRYPVDCQGNTVMSRETVSKVLTFYTEALRDSKTSGTKDDLKIHRLVRINEKLDRRNGSLILMDAVIKSPGTNTTYHDSQYFYLDRTRSTICHPPGYIVSRDVTVHVIVVAKRQTRWLRHFLANMERIYVKTNDKYINVIIAKYGHDDEELMEEYERSQLPSIRTVRHRGAFDKRKAIQLATKKIKEKNSIIFLMDLHIIIPDTIIQLVRKHTIQGQMVFNPVLFRLSHCGSLASSKKPSRGFWETFGYGIIGIYKSDWDKLGKLRTKKYKKGWGGEDWELLDRILTSGLAVQRLRVRHFYHFHHSKKGLWN